MKANPIFQREMARKFDVFQGTICYHLHGKFGMKKKMKEVDRLMLQNIKLRNDKAPGFKKIMEDNKSKILTSDDNWPEKSPDLAPMDYFVWPSLRKSEKK